MKKASILSGSLITLTMLMMALLPGGYVAAAPIVSETHPAIASGNALSQGVVTITFDDGTLTQYTNAYPIMNQFGFKGTLFVISGMVNSDDNVYLNLQEIQEMHSHGWEIDSHTVTHPYLSQLSQSQLEAELANSKSWIVNNSLGSCIALAYPYGDYDSNVADTASKYYRYARATTPGINDFSASDTTLYSVPLWGSSSYNGLDYAEQLVSNAISQNKWAVVMAHGVTDNENDGRLDPNNGWCTTSVFTSFMTFLNNANVPVKNFAQITSANSAPVAVNDTYSVLKNTPLTVAAATGVLSNDTDVDGDILTATNVTSSAHGTLTFNSNGSFTYTPTTGYIGSDSFTYKANDGKVDSNVATVTITITDPKSTFGLNSGDNTWSQSANLLDVMKFQNAASTGTLTKLEILFDNTTPNGNVRLGVYADSSGVPGSRLLDAGEAVVANGWVSISGLSLPVTQNTYYWLAFTLKNANPVRYQSGEAMNSHYWASSTYGALPSNFSGLKNTDYNDCEYIMRATVTAGSGNTPPVAVNDAYTTSEDTALTVAAKGILSNDTDADGDSLTAIKVTDPSHGTLTLNSNGSFTYTPSANYNGSDSFTYKANDGKADSNTATVTITITAVNDAPVAVNDAYTTSTNTALTVAAKGVLSNDTDVDGDSLTAANVTNPAHGTLTFNSNGSFTYTPTTGYTGSDSFTYKANDGKADSNTATVTITITAVNHAPVAVNDAYTTSEDTALTVAAKGILSNDTDADGDSLTAIKVTDPSHGTLTLNSNGSFTYTPSANYNGSDSFTYKANDGKADSNTATVTITVTAVNDAPVAVNDTYSTSQNTALTVAAKGVLSNDTDVDGDSLTAIKVTDPAHGTLTLNSNGSFTYTPTTGYTGSDSFTYKANDGKADSNIATVTITITASTATTFGLNSGDNTWNQSANLLDLMRFQNNAGTGKLTKLEILFDDTTPNGKVRLGVYADNSGVPGSRLLDAGEVTVANGWVSISGLSLSVTQNTYYWLAFTLKNANGVRYQSGQAMYSHYWVSYTYGALPVQFPLSGEDYNDCEYIMRATVTGP